MGISNKDDGTTVETSSILLAEISDFTNPNPPPVKPTFRDVVLLGWSREFPKSVLRACGLRPTGEQEGKTADANKKAWFTSLLVSLVILAAAGGMMALSMCLFFNSRFAAVWLSNAVVIGSLCSAVNWRTRVVILPAFYLINMAAVGFICKSLQVKSDLWFLTVFTPCPLHRFAERHSTQVLADLLVSSTRQLA